MAEVFGLAAAGIGVAPIALELAKTIKKLKDYCRDVKTAREDIQDFVDEVEALHAILQQLTDLGIAECPSSAQGLQHCQDLCVMANNKLRGIVSDLQEGLKLHGRRTQLAFPLKKDKMKQLADRVASAKSSLLLACNVYLMWQMKMQAVTQHQMISEVSAMILAQKDDHHRRFEDLLSGNVAIEQSILTLKAPGRQSSRTSPPRKESHPNLVMSCVWDALCALGCRGWARAFRSYRVVYDYRRDPAFDAIREGNLTALQRLVCDGKASIHDRTYFDHSMLDVMHTIPSDVMCTDGSPQMAVVEYKMDAVRWLHQMGAASAQSAPLSSRYMPLQYSSDSITQWSNDVRYIRDTIDVEFDDGDIELSPRNAMPLNVLTRPIEHWDTSDLSRVARYCFERLRIAPAPAMLRSLLDLIACSKWKQDVWLHRRDDGSTLLHLLARAYLVIFQELILYQNVGTSSQYRGLFHEFLSQAVQADADLHAITVDAKESPFAVLLRSSARLHHLGPSKVVTTIVQLWVETLAALGVDIMRYGDTETRLWWCPHLVESRYQRIYGFAYGSRPGDWRIYLEHPGDAYAGIFWDAIEHPERQLPGSWLEDCEELWEDDYFEILRRKTYWRKYHGREAWDEQHEQRTGVLGEVAE